MMIDEEYVSRLENLVKQMLIPLKNIPFNLVIKLLSGKEVIPFNRSDSTDKELIGILKDVAVEAGKQINEEGISRARANEVGNDIENFVKSAMQIYKLNPMTPTGKKGKKKSAGYPDLLFYHKDKPYYLECKTYNLKNIKSTQRSFFFSPSENFKVIHDTHHFLLSYEMYITDRNIYNCKYWKILSIESLSLDLKHEFNSNNKRIYAAESGAILLAEGSV